MSKTSTDIKFIDPMPLEALNALIPRPLTPEQATEIFGIPEEALRSPSNRNYAIAKAEERR